MGEIITWLLFFFIHIALLVVVVYQLICLADLEFDYINPYDSASRINFDIARIHNTRSFMFDISFHGSLGPNPPSKKIHCKIHPWDQEYDMEKNKVNIAAVAQRKSRINSVSEY